MQRGRPSSADQSITQIFSLITNSSATQCSKACIVHPDVDLSEGERNCVIRCTERYLEALQVVMTATESLVFLRFIYFFHLILSLYENKMINT